ncbi:MAG: spore germination protein [Oscillospiraceae bacterium]
MSDNKNDSISQNLNVNLEYIKEKFSYPKNVGFVIRECNVQFADGFAKAFLAFFDGMTNQNNMNRDILQTLILNNSKISIMENRNDAIYKSLISVAPLSIKTKMSDALAGISFGECAVFVDGCNCMFMADVKGWQSRSVSQPTSEASLTGPQEAFVESIMTNLALVRKILKTPDLVAERTAVGNTSKTPIAIMYLKGVTNRKIVKEVRRRLSNIDVEYVFSSGDIEMLIEKNTFFPMTHTLKTERPDKVAAMLADGKVVVIVQGSPFALVLPTTAGDLIEATEDNYVRVPEANMMRIIRILGMTLSLLLPGCFVAIMLYHQEIIPTDLLLAIEASREKVPFPLVFELIIMEFAFELIKEASIRVPSPIGSSLGIIGGLILGQAAVEANMVSPILIIIVSIAGLGSFATPSVALSRSISLLRFIYIIVGACGGLLGVVCGIIINLALMASSTSYGVPFLSPLIASKNSDSVAGSLFVKPIWKKENRPSDLHPQDPKKQPHISRKWQN